MTQRYELVISPTARRQLTERLPESVAFAAYDFIVGPLLDNPQRVGKRLRPPIDDRQSARRGTYRVIYRIDTTNHRVTVVGVVHRWRCLPLRASTPAAQRTRPLHPRTDVPGRSPPRPEPDTGSRTGPPQPHRTAAAAASKPGNAYAQ